MSNTEFDDESTEFQEEWLSAYLDGELSDEQRELVEQRISDDPGVANTLENLRKVRSLVSSLPRWTDGELSTTAILARADEIDDVDSDISENAPADLGDTLLGDVDAIVDQEPQHGTTDEEFLAARLTQRAASMRWLRPAATAASLLLILGIGYTLWPVGSQSELASATRSDSADAPQGEMEEQGAAPDSFAPDSPAPGLPMPEMQSDFSSQSLADSNEPSLPLPPVSESALAEIGDGASASRARSLPELPQSMAMGAVDANVAELPMPALDLPLDSVASRDESFKMEMRQGTDMPESTLPKAAAPAPSAPDSAAANSESANSESMFFAKSQAWNDNDVKAAIAGSPELFGRISQSEAVQGQGGRGMGAVANQTAMAILTLENSETRETYESLLSEAASLTSLRELNASSASRAQAENEASMPQTLPSRPNLLGQEELGQERAGDDELPVPATSRRKRKAASSMIALFLSKGEADALLQASVLKKTGEFKPGSVFWISAGPSSGSPLQAGDQVILILNSGSR